MRSHKLRLLTIAYYMQFYNKFLLNTGNNMNNVKVNYTIKV